MKFDAMRVPAPYRAASGGGVTPRHRHCPEDRLMPALRSYRPSGRVLAFLPLSLPGVALFACCMVGPNYKRPQVEVQSKWSRPVSAPVSIVDDASPPPKWWTMLDDPKLDSLVQRAARGNLSLSIARSRIREARAQRSIAVGGLLPGVGSNGAYTYNRRAGPLAPV